MKTIENVTQLATRITIELHREAKLFCVSKGITMMEFVANAMTEKLAREKTVEVPVVGAQAEATEEVLTA